MKAKKFLIVNAADVLGLAEAIEGTVTEAREVLKSETYKDGDYLIYELIDKATKSTVKVEPTVKVTFNPTRKRPRKEKAAGASQKAAK